MQTIYIFKDNKYILKKYYPYRGIHLRRLNNKGISPVIATVILVAVAIAIAIAVAFWMTGIIGLFTRFEKIEITYIYATKSGTTWTITLKAKNTGTADATIDNVFINGKPVSAIDAASITSPTDLASDGTYTLSAGSEVVIEISINDGDFTSGQSVEVKIHTASGQEYPKLVNLP